MRKDSVVLYYRLLVVLALLFSSFSCSLVGTPLGFAQPVFAAGETEEVQVHASMIADSKAVAAGKKFRLGIELKMEPGWHTYYKESGDAGMPSKVEWALPPGFKAGDLIWERPHKMEDSGIVTYGYDNHTVMAAEIQAPADLKAGQKLQFKAKVKWLACKDACVPGRGDVSLTLPVVASVAEAQADNQAKFAPVNFNGTAKEAVEGGSAAKANPKDHTEIPATDLSTTAPSTSTATPTSTATSTATPTEPGSAAGSKTAPPAAAEPPGGILGCLTFAFLGGFILNFMPCVLPVISIKIFSLVQQAGEDPRKVFQHGITFAAGILLSFLALGLLLIAIQAAGQKIGWGFQFQYPVFVMAMACIVTVFALSMFGVFYVDLGGQQSIDKLASSEGLSGSFFKGVLATVLSTPCTAPFLAPVLGFALLQPGWVILSLFAVIALGMSSPYLVLAMKPEWMKFMPKPGTWMERFKESLGFMLMATTVWLISVLIGLVSSDAVIAAISFLLMLCIASWIVGNFINLSSSNQKRMTVWAVALACVGSGYWFFLRPYPELLGTVATLGTSTEANSKDGIQWQKFSLEELDKARKANKTVFIDFTARWCLTCKANEATIINTPPVIEKFKALNVVPLKADWTAQDPEIFDLLQQYGRSGVPVYVIYAPGSEQADVLPEVISQQIVIEHLDKAGPSK